MITRLKTDISNVGHLFLEENNESDSKSESYYSLEASSHNSSTISGVETAVPSLNTFWCPSGVKYNSLTNEIFVADSFNHQIKIVDSVTGKIVRRFYLQPTTENMKQITPRDVHFNSSGAQILVVTDSCNHRCHFLNSLDFSITHSFGEYGNQKAQFCSPRGVCVDHLNRIYVCDRGKLLKDLI